MHLLFFTPRHEAGSSLLSFNNMTFVGIIIMLRALDFLSARFTSIFKQKVASMTAQHRDQKEVTDCHSSTGVSCRGAYGQAGMDTFYGNTPFHLALVWLPQKNGYRMVLLGARSARLCGHRYVYLSQNQNTMTFYCWRNYVRGDELHPENET